jgi:oxygen-independent coproporphyrinogen-3 oxidase
MSGQNVGLYIHIPFCRFKCTYCDFNAYAGMRSLYEPYARAVVREISDFPLDKLEAKTIYFGGGTPSLLPLPWLADILTACRATFHVPRDAEISLEANPGTRTWRTCKVCERSASTAEPGCAGPGRTGFL